MLLPINRENRKEDNMRRQYMTFADMVLISLVCWFSLAEIGQSQETSGKAFLSEGFEGNAKAMFCILHFRRILAVMA